jgi:hypothetical protein
MARKKAVALRRPIVVDTNVLIAANGADTEWKPIASNCANRLQAVMTGNIVCTDTLGLILEEYGNKLPSPSRAGFGDMFYLWLAKHRFNDKHCQSVELTPHENSFEQFPDLADEVATIIDPSDRKFIAVAHAHPEKPPILQATDSKWIGWKESLATAGITIDFIDEAFLRPYYEKKMGHLERQETDGL